MPLVFIGYWFVFGKNLKLQNAFVVAVSYLFYGWWDWRFLLLIAFTSGCSFFSGVYIERYRHKGGISAWINGINIALNLAILGVFKYYNFFAQSFADTFMQGDANSLLLQIILPVGISFYTFQALSYSIDVFRKKLATTTDLVSFFAYVSFFPQLVAGPIERATNLLPQFYTKRTFTYAQGASGLRLMLYGFFKKMVIADNCSIWANDIFNNYTQLPASVLAMGAVYFALQIYGDFSGYSDIARGAARLFGIELMVNFRVPYFSRDVAEFWRRWNISLTTWFRDYLYIPLGGSKTGTGMAIRNTFIVFVVSGFWHGANWTFIAWGGINALFFIPLLITGHNRRHLNTVAENRLLPTPKEIIQMAATFAIACVAWIFFRAESIAQAIDYIAHMVQFKVFFTNFYYFPPKILVLIALFLVLEWFIYRRDDSETLVASWPLVLRHTFYFILIVTITLFTPNEAQSFIYFQF